MDRNSMRSAKLSGLGLALMMGATMMLPLPALSLTTEEILNYRGPDREQILLEGAKKEGQVTLYCALIVNQALKPISDAFAKKYPFIKIAYWRADSEDIAAKLMAEVKANNLQADLVEGTGVGEMVIQAGLVQPYYTPMIEQVPQKYRDPAGIWTPTRLSYFSVAYNTKLVPPDDVPKTYEDLLDPKWKGKLSWRIGSASGTSLFITNLRMAWGEEKARAYFEKLAAQKIVNFGSGSARTLVDRVIAGEYPIALNIFAHHPFISKAKGAPVNSQLMEPVATTAGTMVVPKGVKHPHASMLLADFILSKEGQTILSKAEYFPVRPDVEINETIKGVVPSLLGKTENFVGSEQLNKYTASSEEIYQNLFR